MDDGRWLADAGILIVEGCGRRTAVVNAFFMFLGRRITKGVRHPTSDRKSTDTGENSL
jgi:hypothetical protein